MKIAILSLPLSLLNLCIVPSNLVLSAILVIQFFLSAIIDQTFLTKGVVLKVILIALLLLLLLLLLL